MALRMETSPQLSLPMDSSQCLRARMEACQDTTITMAMVATEVDTIGIRIMEVMVTIEEVGVVEDLQASEAASMAMTVDREASGTTMRENEVGSGRTITTLEVIGSTMMEAITTIGREVIVTTKSRRTRVLRMTLATMLLTSSHMRGP